MFNYLRIGYSPVIFTYRNRRNACFCGSWHDNWSTDM